MSDPRAATPGIPLRVNALHLFDQLWQSLDRFENDLNEELMIAWTTPAQRVAITAAIYSSQAAYAEGGFTFRKGLFPWEERLISSPLFPQSGHVLVGAVGGGREIAGLVSRGYAVSAFEPSNLVVHAQEFARRHGRVNVARGAYTDLIDSANGRTSPLAGLLRAAPFDAVILGWGSLSHVVDRDERRALLDAVQSVAPGAPVVLSYLPFHEVTRRGPMAWLRRMLRSVERQGHESIHFTPWQGFSVGLRPDDIRLLGAASGYRVETLDENEYPHALLVPMAGARGRG